MTFASPSSSASSHCQVARRGARSRVRPRVVWASRGSGGANDLAHPLGMSFAAILSQVMNKNKEGGKISSNLVSKMCLSAVKESIINIHGDKYDYFLINFEKSFRSTFGTLHVINHTAIPDQEETTSDCADPGNISNPSSENSHATPQPFLGPSISTKTILHGNLNNQLSNISTNECYLSNDMNHHIITKLERSATEQMCSNNLKEICGDPGNISNLSLENSHVTLQPTTTTQVILHGKLNNQLSNISTEKGYRSEGMNHHIITTLERSVTEQVRSNNLKEFEMGLIMKKLELKRSQLELSSYSHMLERVKVQMGAAKAIFREEKLKNQMQDARFSELVKSFTDVLVTGLIIMSVCFGYGTYIFSYQRITEVTEACSAISQEPKSWWLPKQVSSFNSGWLFVRCHVVALTRLGFGIMIFLALAWLSIQKSYVARPNMPITFNIILLGVLCGIIGKGCVDALGGDGLHWLIFWELLCLIHFLVNAFPATIYSLLHGPISVSQGVEVARRRYRIRRYMLYTILLFILPLSAGLLPFASVVEWMAHLRERVNLVNIGGAEL